MGGRTSPTVTKHVHLRMQTLANRLHDILVDRGLIPADTDRRNLWGWFPELAALQGQCAFADCTHHLEKGCAVLAAVAEGRIHPRRHQSYLRIYQTLPQ